MLNLYGVAYPAETYAEWRQLVHVDDIARVEAEREETLRRRQSFNIEYRVMHGSGEVRWIALRGEGYYGDDGEVKRVLASIWTSMNASAPRNNCVKAKSAFGRWPIAHRC